MPDATMNAACLNAQRALPGWYGKLPGAGDFVDRRMPRAIAQSWELWLARGIASIQESGAQSFSERYAHAPIWCFAIPAGAGVGAVQFGCLAPSFDRVGRRYPLLVVHVLELSGFSRDAASWASASLPAIGETLAQAIRQAYEPEQFDRALAVRMAGALGEGDEAPSPANGWPNLLDYFDPDGATSFWWVSAGERGSSQARAHTGALDGALFSRLFGGDDLSLNVDE